MVHEAPSTHLHAVESRRALQNNATLLRATSWVHNNHRCTSDTSGFWRFILKELCRFSIKSFKRFHIEKDCFVLIFTCFRQKDKNLIFIYFQTSTLPALWSQQKFLQIGSDSNLLLILHLILYTVCIVCICRGTWCTTEDACEEAAACCAGATRPRARVGWVRGGNAKGAVKRKTVVHSMQEFIFQNNL